MDIFRRTNKDREEKAGTQPRSEEKVSKLKVKMSQADFAYGPKKETRPPMSKKWVEKGK